MLLSALSAGKVVTISQGVETKKMIVRMEMRKRRKKRTRRTRRTMRMKKKIHLQHPKGSVKKIGVSCAIL